jgi:ABC-type Mn2+/Zn2+ transport system permease subunit
VEILNERFIRYALAAAILSGSLCSFVGVYVVLKRIAFVGIAVAETAALGVAAGLMLGWNPTATSLALALVAACAFWLFGARRTLSRESILAFTYVFASALAVVLIAKNPAAESRGLDLVSGNLLYVRPADIIAIAATAAVIVPMHLVFRKSLAFVSFDQETAAAVGLRARTYDLFVYLSLGLSIAVSMKVAGVLFVFGSLIVPPLTGLLLCRRLNTSFVVAVGMSVATVAAGTVCSVFLDWPTAPTIIVVMCAVFVAAAAVRTIVRA